MFVRVQFNVLLSQEICSFVYDVQVFFLLSSSFCLWRQPEGGSVLDWPPPLEVERREGPLEELASGLSGSPNEES